MAGRSAPGASLVARVLDVLGAFDDQHRQLTLAQLAERAGLPPATALRIVRELVAGGALTRGADRGPDGRVSEEQALRGPDRPDSLPGWAPRE